MYMCGFRKRRVPLPCTYHRTLLVYEPLPLYPFTATPLRQSFQLLHAPSPTGIHCTCIPRHVDTQSVYATCFHLFIRLDATPLFNVTSCRAHQVSYAAGASAGGLVAGLFAAGVSPKDMGEKVVRFRRSDFWDPVGFGGILRGKKFEVTSDCFVCLFDCRNECIDSWNRVELMVW